MKKTLMLSMSGVALVLAVIAAVAIPGAAPEADAMGCYDCRCTNTFTTGSQTVGGSGWTGGASCAEANAVLKAQLEAEAGCDSFCLSNLVITTACMMDDPKWYPVTGYLQYQCEICIDKCF